MLPVAEAGAGPATMPASGKVCSKQSGSRQQQAVASVSPLSAFEPGYVKQHNKAVSAALSDPSVKVRSYFPNSHGQRMTQGSCATVERDPTQPNIRNMHLNSQPSFFSPAEGPPPGIQCPLVPIGPGQHRALHPHGVGGCGAQQWWWEPGSLPPAGTKPGAEGHRAAHKRVYVTGTRRQSGGHMVIWVIWGIAIYGGSPHPQTLSHCFILPPDGYAGWSVGAAALPGGRHVPHQCKDGAGVLQL